MPMRFYEVRGKVQNVMFRQTVIRAMHKRGLRGGASNDKGDKGLVRMTLDGSTEAVDELMAEIESGKPLNDWGAKATSVKEVSKELGMSLTDHQVTTDNVDNFKWNPNVVMHL